MVADQMDALTTLNDELPKLGEPSSLTLDQLRDRINAMRATMDRMRDAQSALVSEEAGRYRAMRNDAICPICDDYSGNCAHRDISRVNGRKCHAHHPDHFDALN